MATLDELEAEAMKLDLESRTELVRRLTASTPGTPAAAEARDAPPTPETLPTAEGPPTPEATKPLSDDERERLWLKEAMSRSRELKQRELRPPLPAGAVHSGKPPAVGNTGRRPVVSGRGEGRPRQSPKKRPAQRRKPRPKPVHARAKRAKARPKAAKRRPKARTRPRSRR